MKQKFNVTGMTCSACSSHVEKCVVKLPGLEKVAVNLLTETMQVEYDEATLSQEEIIKAVEKAGYGASAKEIPNQALGDSCKESLPKGNRNGNKKDEEINEMKTRLLISILFLIPLMYVAMYHMFKDWFGLPIPEIVMKAFHGNENAMNFALTQFLLYLPILYVNRKFFIVGFNNLRRLSPNMDSLIALGASAAMIYGVFAMYRISVGLGFQQMEVVAHYAHDLYFESAGTILTLITVGKYLESRSKGKTSEAIAKLLDLSPKTALLLKENGDVIEVPTEQIKQGDVFLLKPGSSVPVDGTILEGNSTINEAAITGESIPVEKREGDEVISATVNQGGFLKCVAKRVGEDTTLAQIITLVEEASASKAPIAKLADKISGIFVPIVIGIAIIAGLIWLLVGASAEFAISIAIAVLVISCPCALGLATPVAIMVGTGVGARNGILIKSGEALQIAKGIDTVVMDKTGTITEGKLEVMELSIDESKTNEKELLNIVGAIENKSEHPLSKAIVKAAMKQELIFPEIDDFEAVFGRGVKGKVKETGIVYYIGNNAYMDECGIALQVSIKNQADDMAERGMTPLFVAKEGTYLGIIGVADKIKDTSKEAISMLKAMGIKVIMLTGDHLKTAQAVQRKLQIEEVIAQVLPKDKEKKIRELKAEGRRVAMIGDGINDAPALAAADVGIAIGAGTDIAMESADIILMKSDLRDAATAIRLSKKVIANIKQNLFWAFFYNSIGIPLAAGVLYASFGLKLNPMFGAAAMSLSSVCVVANALRLRGFKVPYGTKNNIPLKQETKKEEQIMNTTKTITIEGMSCGHCTARVQKALESEEGIQSVSMSLEEKTAKIEMNQAISDERLTEIITEAGYEVISIN